MRRPLLAAGHRLLAAGLGQGYRRPCEPFFPSREPSAGVREEEEEALRRCGGRGHCSRIAGRRRRWMERGKEDDTRAVRSKRTVDRSLVTLFALIHRPFHGGPHATGRHREREPPLPPARAAMGGGAEEEAVRAEEAPSCDGEEELVRAEESPSGGVDVWSDAVSSHAPDHLLVMVHGILGSTADWSYGANEFVKQLSDDVIVHCSEKNISMLTLDGVDVMGERLADEVLDVISRKPELTKISFLAHSVGGLVARYAIAKLYRHPDDTFDGKTKGTISGLEAMNFITIATPHLCSRGNRQVPFLFGFITMEKVACRVIHWIFKRTGRHLFLTDDNEEKPPLLQRMVEDYGDLYFISALRAFKRRVAYANADCDHIVGWRTSSIRRNTELPKWEESLCEKYPHIVHEEHSQELNDENCQDSATDCDSDILEDQFR